MKLSVLLAALLGYVVKVRREASSWAIVGSLCRTVKTHLSRPETINPDGTVRSTTAAPGFSAAVMPLLMTSGEKAAATLLLRNVLAQIQPSTGPQGDPPNYYDQNLALFALGWQEQRFRFATDGTLRVQWKK